MNRPEDKERNATVESTAATTTNENDQTYPNYVNSALIYDFPLESDGIISIQQQFSHTSTNTNDFIDTTTTPEILTAPILQTFNQNIDNNNNNNNYEQEEQHNKKRLRGKEEDSNNNNDNMNQPSLFIDGIYSTIPFLSSSSLPSSSDSNNNDNNITTHYTYDLPRFYIVIQPEIIQRKCYAEENRYLKPKPLLVRLHDSWKDKIEGGSFEIHLVHAGGDRIHSQNPILVCDEGLSREFSRNDHEFPCSIKLKTNSGLAGLRLLLDFSYTLVGGTMIREIILSTPFFVANKNKFPKIHDDVLSSVSSTIGVGGSIIISSPSSSGVNNETTVDRYLLAKEILAINDT